MSSYSIKYLENITGIKAHTIRIWEKRYALLEPKRTSTNIRYYDDEDLRKILNVSTLLNEGYKISHIAELPTAELNKKVRAALDSPADLALLPDYFTNEIILASIRYDKAALDKLINTCALRITFPETVERVLYPALNRTGILWQSDEVNPGQEHFFSNFVRQKLFSAIDGLPEPKPGNSKYLLFLPENEGHEIGLLYFYYTLLRHGIEAIYLGQHTPLESLRHAASSWRPTHLVLFVTTHVSLAGQNKYLRDLSKRFPECTVIICGNPDYLKQLKLPANVTSLSTPGAAGNLFTGKEI